MSDATPDVDLAGELLELRAEGEQQKAETEKAGRDILALLDLGEPVVTITYDEAGLMANLTIDPKLREGLTAEELEREVNVGLFRTSPLPSLNSSAAQTGVSVPQQRVDLSRLFQSALSGELASSRDFRNDLKTVTVVSSRGRIDSVRLEPAWVNSTPDRLIADEIVRMARIAALATGEPGSDTTGEAQNG